MTRRANVAVRAEPTALGVAHARDPLAREVRLLGALLGQVIVEQEPPPAAEHQLRWRPRHTAPGRMPAPGTIPPWP
jgi:hypothetical protein